MEPNNSGGGNNKILTTVLVVTVVGVVGYLIYKAGKGTAAANAGTSPVYNGTNIPTATHSPAGTKTAGSTSGAKGNVSAITGLLGNVLSLFKKKGTTAATSPIKASGGAGAVLSGGAGGVLSGGIGNTTVNNTDGTRYDNDWDGNGGYMTVYADGGADYFYSDGTYFDSDPIGTWEASNSSGSSSNTDGTRYDNNWDNAGGYMIVFADGGADYYGSDGTYYDSDPIGTWE